MLPWNEKSPYGIHVYDQKSSLDQKARNLKTALPLFFKTGRIALVTDLVFEESPVKEFFDVGKRCCGNVAYGFFGEEPLMRRDQDIGKRQEPRQDIVTDHLG